MAEIPRFFGRRRGKRLRDAGQARVQSLLPDLTLRLPEAGEGLDPQRVFARPMRAIWLEVGFGGGEHLAWQASQHADIGMIGCEVFVNGIAALLGHIQKGALGNIRIFPEDARLLMPVLPDGCLDRVFVLFPDPWPKKRHAERRFIGGDNLDQLARLLRSGGELRIATDDPTYQRWARDQMTARQDFCLVSGDDPTVKTNDWPGTRYEAKARQAGRVSHFLRYLRV